MHETLATDAALVGSQQASYAAETNLNYYGYMKPLPQMRHWWDGNELCR
jgi:hypothetical protein